MRSVTVDSFLHVFIFRSVLKQMQRTLQSLEHEFCFPHLSLTAPFFHSFPAFFHTFLVCFPEASPYSLSSNASACFPDPFSAKPDNNRLSSMCSAFFLLFRRLPSPDRIPPLVSQQNRSLFPSEEEKNFIHATKRNARLCCDIGPLLCFGCLMHACKNVRTRILSF